MRVATFIAQIILVSSFLGMGAILVRKIPVLKKLEVVEKKQTGFLATTKEKIKIYLFQLKKFFSSSFWNIFLQKVLSKTKILSLRVEAKCTHLLAKIREKSKRSKESEQYWEKIRKISLRKKKQ